MLERDLLSKLTELERHQLAYRLRGLKYCDAKGKVIGEVQEALIPYHNCSIEVKQEIINYVTRYSMSTALSTARVFGIILSEFHILCPHVPSCQDFTEYEEMKQFAEKSGIEPIKKYSVCQICLENVSS